MAYYGSNLVTGNAAAVALTVPPTFPRPAIGLTSGGQTVLQDALITFASGTNPANNDVIEMMVLPAGMVPVDFLVVCDDFDTNGSPTITCRAGLMSGTPGDITRAIATVGTELLPNASTTLQAAAATRHPVSAAQAVLVHAIAPSTSPRSIGVAITANAATSPASARSLRLLVWYRTAQWGA